MVALIESTLRRSRKIDREAVWDPAACLEVASRCFSHGYQPSWITSMAMLLLSRCHEAPSSLPSTPSPETLRTHKAIKTQAFRTRVSVSPSKALGTSLPPHPGSVRHFDSLATIQIITGDGTALCGSHASRLSPKASYQ
jgi:hypothetical protein